VGISSVVMVLSGCWIIRVLIQIEKTKVVAVASVLQDDGTGVSDLQFEESTTEKQLEVEHADGSPSEIEMSPTGKSKKENDRSPASSPTASAKPVTARKARQRQRRISWSFINIQIFSVLTLIFLTYLILVQSNAAIFWRMLGSFCVFGVFLRFQIGEEIRRQRVDRLMLLISLFLLIASMLSALVYSMATLKQGEIYEGPARIVGYSTESYNNTMHDPTTRTDIAVSWGKDWGCPMSGGKVCQANVHGAMCQSHPDKEQTKHKPNYGTRLLEEDKKLEDAEDAEEALEEDLEDEEKSNEELEDENENLSEENAKLEKEIEELKEENEVEDEENQSLVDQENAEMYDIADEYDEDILIIEEEEEEDAQAYEDFEYEEDEEQLEDEIEAATDDQKKEDLEEDLQEDEDQEFDIDEEYEEVYDEYDQYIDEYGELEEEDYNDFVEAQDETVDLEDEKNELKEEAEETEEEIEEGDYSIPEEEGDEDETEVVDNTGDEEYYEEEEAIEEEFEEDEYEEMVEEEMEEEFEEEWYWDEYPTSYDDDNYEDAYWSYDWDSVWGDYACEDLFDADISGQTYDPDARAGEDQWPSVYIYGSCKTCEAYILDRFAEEAFEETQEYKMQAIVYLAGAAAGFVWSLVSYIKYRVMPTHENELELLGSDGGVLA